MDRGAAVGADLGSRANPAFAAVSGHARDDARGVREERVADTEMKRRYVYKTYSTAKIFLEAKWYSFAELSAILSLEKRRQILLSKAMRKSMRTHARA